MFDYILRFNQNGSTTLQNRTKHIATHCSQPDFWTRSVQTMTRSQDAQTISFSHKHTTSDGFEFLCLSVFPNPNSHRIVCKCAPCFRHKFWWHIFDCKIFGVHKFGLNFAFIQTVYQAKGTGS